MYGLRDIFTILGVTLLFFLVFREVICWYFKINQRIALEKERNIILQEIAKKMNLGDQKEHFKLD